MPVKRLSYPNRVSWWKRRSRGRGRTYNPEVCNVERARVVSVCVGWDQDWDRASGNHAESESRGGNEDGGELHFDFDCGGWLSLEKLVIVCCEESGCGGNECELEAERTVVLCSSCVELMSCV